MQPPLIDTRTRLMAAVLVGDREQAVAEILRDRRQLRVVSTVLLFPLRGWAPSCGSYGGVTQQTQPCKRVTSNLEQRRRAPPGMMDTVGYAVAQVEQCLCPAHRHGPAAAVWRGEIAAAQKARQPPAIRASGSSRQMTALMAAVWNNDELMARTLIRLMSDADFDVATADGVCAVTAAVAAPTLLKMLLDRSPGVSATGEYSLRLPRSAASHPLVVAVLRGLPTSVRVILAACRERGAMGTDTWADIVNARSFMVHNLCGGVLGEWCSARRGVRSRTFQLVSSTGLCCVATFVGRVPHMINGDCGSYSVDIHGARVRCGVCRTPCTWVVRLAKDNRYFVECETTGRLLSFTGAHYYYAVHPNFTHLLRTRAELSARRLNITANRHDRGLAWCELMMHTEFDLGAILSRQIVDWLTTMQFRWLLHQLPRDRGATTHVENFLSSAIRWLPAERFTMAIRQKVQEAIECPSFNVCTQTEPTRRTLLEVIASRADDSVAQGQRSGLFTVMFSAASTFASLHGHYAAPIDWAFASAYVTSPQQLTVLATHPGPLDLREAHRAFAPRGGEFAAALRAVQRGPDTTTPSEWLTDWFKTTRWVMLLASARPSPHLPNLPEAVVLYICGLSAWANVREHCEALV